MTTVFVSSWAELKEAVTNPLDPCLEIILEVDILFENPEPLLIPKNCRFIIKSDEVLGRANCLQIKPHLSHRHFLVQGALCLEHITLDGGGLAIDGGYVNLAKNATLKNGNHQNGGGALIDNDGRLDMMPGASVTHNQAKNKGGAIYVQSGSFVMDGGLIQHNQAADGGAIYNNGTAALKADALVQFNVAGRGGAVYNLQSLNVSQQAALLENQADKGGGIYNVGRSQLRDRVKLAQNQAADGGAVFEADGRILLTGQPHICENTAKNQGGGIYLAAETGGNPSLWLGGGLFQGNHATHGGALYLNDMEGPVSVELEAGEFLENVAEIGGALYLDLQTSGRTIGMDPGLVFTGNTASEPQNMGQPEATPVPKPLHRLLDSHHIWVSIPPVEAPPQKISWFKRLLRWLRISK